MNTATPGTFNNERKRMKRPEAQRWGMTMMTPVPKLVEEGFAGFGNPRMGRVEHGGHCSRPERTASVRHEEASTYRRNLIRSLIELLGYLKAVSMCNLSQRIE
jgi:hypothetical protein